MTKNILVTAGIAVLISFFLLPALVSANERRPVEVKKRDKCPVCGMFVAKYPEWIAQVIFKDGTHDVFDGPKDMFKYYFNLKEYNTSRNPADIASIYVTEYYSAKLTDAYKVLFVLGSDVYGPMGKELIPVGTPERAKEFMRDHNGRRVLKFEEVRPGDLR